MDLFEPVEPRIKIFPGELFRDQSFNDGLIGVAWVDLS